MAIYGGRGVSNVDKVHEFDNFADFRPILGHLSEISIQDLSFGNGFVTLDHFIICNPIALALIR